MEKTFSAPVTKFLLCTLYIGKICNLSQPCRLLTACFQHLKSFLSELGEANMLDATDIASRLWKTLSAGFCTPVALQRFLFLA